jgi:hypothetical protein
MLRSLCWPFAVLVALSVSSARADSLECEGRRVSPGDTKVDLLGKCGEPTAREERVEERQTATVDKASQAGEARKVTEVVETWVYDFGPQRFVQYVTLTGGKVRAVKSGDYGTASNRRVRADVVPVAKCDAMRSFRLGARSIEVLALCGEPATREVKQVETAAVVGDGSGNTVTAATSNTAVETWTYNFGATVFLRRLVIKDGLVAKIETGGYGYGQ